MLKKLRTKFVGIMMAFVTAMLLTIFGLVIFFTDIGLEMQSRQTVQNLISSLTSPGIPPKKPGNASSPYLAVWLNHWGEIIQTECFWNLADEDSIGDMLQQAMDSGAQSGILEEHTVYFGKSRHLAGQLLVFVDISGNQIIIRNLVVICTALCGVSFLIFLGLSLLLSRWAIKPVENAWQQQKQFVADASHELKTPLTVIMTNAELLQAERSGDGNIQQFSESILTMSKQMRGLVEGLLELARVDNGAVQTRFSVLDLSQLVTDGLLPFEPLFFEKGLCLAAEVESGIRVRGSESHLRQVLEILLDNAMKYGIPNGDVTVTLNRQGSHTVLAVSSCGEPISKEDLRNIFKRFYRIDKARTRDGSYGLGLSIAQSIIEEHNGKIWAESQNGRNTFYVQLSVPAG